MNVGRYQELGSEHVPALARLPHEWSEVLTEEKSFRAGQVFRWIHARGVFDPANMTDLPLPLRQRLVSAGIRAPAAVEHAHRAHDGTVKLVLRLEDSARIETVLIPMGDAAGAQDADVAAADDEDDAEDDALEPAAARFTQCISTQVGCAMKCTFCATGVPGLIRHLNPDEIVGQVLIGRTHLGAGQRLTNIVLMGMGEPLHNYEATARALRLLSHTEGIGISRRRITVSTVGLVPEIARLGRDFEGKVGLAVSLHAPDDATRNTIVPSNKRYPVGDIIEALRTYPLPRRRRITIEYALIDGINDSLEHARKLAKLLRPVRVKINLIPLNRVAHSPLQPPPMERVLAFQRLLAGAGYTCLLRKRRGDDISAACGQLAARRTTAG